MLPAAGRHAVLLNRLGSSVGPFGPTLTACRSFDRLPDDFPYALLTLIVVGMAVGTAVLSQLQTRAVVKKKWQ